MFVKKSRFNNREIIIDLTGPDGNAFHLLGVAKRLGMKCGYDEVQISDLRNEMMSGDYENLLRVFDKHFGDFVILER
tara:strand:- start:1480 stop:1710 length:231 start_codon:yes stop_codon:yes gene_type:complete